MCHSGKSGKVMGALMQLQLLSKTLKLSGWQMPIIKGHLSDPYTMADVTHPVQASCKWTESVFPYQLFSAIFNQRHKRYLIHASSNVEGYKIAIEFSRLMSKIDTGKGGPVKESGGRLGKLDAANEAGMFHKVNRSKLEHLKKTTKDKPMEKKSSADPAAKPEE